MGVKRGGDCARCSLRERENVEAVERVVVRGRCCTGGWSAISSLFDFTCSFTHLHLSRSALACLSALMAATAFLSAAMRSGRGPLNHGARQQGLSAACGRSHVPSWHLWPSGSRLDEVLVSEGWSRGVPVWACSGPLGVARPARNKPTLSLTR